MAKVLAHIVLFHSSELALRTVDSLTHQDLGGHELEVLVTNNDSDGTIVEKLRQAFPNLEIRQNSANLGFCGAQNQGAGVALERGADFFLMVNPDVWLETDCVQKLAAAAEQAPQAGLFTPLLFRADAELNPLHPLRLDAAGMELTPSLRHFDIGSGALDAPDYHVPRTVFGGTGALLLLRRKTLEDLLLPRTKFDSLLWQIYPQLQEGSASRPQLFDEAFFAFREDADLAWRAELTKWKCLFVPAAKAWHVRRVLPERRAQLPSELNAMGVRNRFLLQFNNLGWDRGVVAILWGALFRNLFVILTVLLLERKSIGALGEARRLLPRALEQRRQFRSKHART